MLAEQVAQHIGVDLHQIPTTEGNDAQYIANEGKACLACKTHLYSTLQSIHHRHVQQQRDNRDAAAPATASCVQLYNGTNADDLQDPTRLGLIAARHFDVKSPIQDLTKAQVRAVARQLPDRRS